jgi:hypothetical protein
MGTIADLGSRMGSVWVSTKSPLALSYLPPIQGWILFLESTQGFALG